MAIHKRSFKCFDTLLDDLSQKVPLPFGVRTVTTPRGTHTIKHLEQLQDGGCYLCSDRRHPKPINMELAGKRHGIWYQHSRRPQRPEASSGTPPGHSNLAYRQRRILLVKNSEPGMRRSIVLSRRSARSLRAFLDEVSEVMQFHVRKLYTAEGRRIDSMQSLMTCPGVLVCVGREAFSPMLVNFIRKTSEEKLPGLGTKSPVQSRSSEYDEGHESKKNVNFGLETKKSIIHPRSDSSNRSARFSLSSEKSFGVCPQARPAIMNDDIEKRVLVNKDGSLSVEMRVRFHLQNDETLQWSTQIKKSPSLTNESCPASQAQSNYLQHGQSGSCSDPDSTSYEGMEYPSQPLQCALEENHCPCCYQRREPHFDLWENPAHSHKPPPVPPPHPSNHTVMRHTHSSSSSSSCNSRRVVRCRARLSRSPGGSGSEQNQLVQEEMCVTEQVERRVEVAQDGDTQVEVCKVSRCCSRTEVVAMDTNLRPVSRKSVEGELMVGEDENRPLSAVSISSHVLQSLKEDQDDEDDDLPPSVSQCSHRNEPSPSPTPATHLEEKPESMVSASSLHSAKHRSPEQREARGSRASSAACSCHCGATSSVSNISNSRIPNSEEDGAADAEDEELKRGVSGLSGCTGLSVSTLRSGASSVCPDCGGCKLMAYNSNSRASKRSDQSNRTPQPVSPLPTKENGDDGHDDAASDDSAGSTQSNKSNLTIHGRLSATPNHLKGRAPSAMSGSSNPESTGGDEERAPSATSATSHRSNRSNRSHQSGCNGIQGVTAENEEERAPSATSATSHRSNRSNRSHQSGCNGIQGVTAENEEERAPSATSATSHRSNRSNRSHQSGCNGISGVTAENEEERAPSATSATSHRSNRSHQSGCNGIQGVTAENEEERAPSATSATSHRSNRSNRSHQSGCNGISGVTAENEEERAPSATSATSHRSNRSHQSGCNGIQGVTAENEEERAPSATSATSHRSNRSNRSHQSGCNGISGVTAENEEERAPSAMSARSNLSAKSGKSQKSEVEVPVIGLREKAEGENTVERAVSSLSDKSSASAKSHKSSCNKAAAVEEGQVDKRAPSSLSVKSNASAKSGKADSVVSDKSSKSNVSAKSGTSHKSASCQCAKAASPGGKAEEEPMEDVTEKEEGAEVEERAASAMSAKSNLSHKSAKASERSPSPRSEAGGDVEERATSQMSGKLSSKSSKSNDNERAASAGSGKSASSAKPHQANTEVDRSLSAASGRSHISAKSHKSTHSASSPNPDDAEVPVIETNGEEKEDEPGERLGSAMSVRSASSVRSGASHKSNSGRNLTNSNVVTIKTPDGADEEGSETKERASSQASGRSRKSNHNETTEDVDKSEKCHGQTLSPKRTPSPRTRSPKAPAASPVQQLLPNPDVGEKRGPSALSVHSITSAKSGRSKCSCGAAHKKEDEEKEGEHKEDGKSEGCSEEATSFLSSSSKTQRKGSEKPLSRNSSGSVSLGLPEDQDTADSDSGKSTVSFRNNAEDKVRIMEKTAAPSVSKSPKDSSGKGDEERVRSAMSQKSNDNGRKSASSHNHPAVDIPTIEMPRGGEEGGEQNTERAASAVTVKSGRSRKSCHDCGVKAAARTLDANSKERREVGTESVTNADKMDTPNDRAPSAMSGSAKARRKSPARASVSGHSDTENQDFNRPGSEAKERKDITQNKTPSVYSQSPCCLRPESAASTHSKSKKTSQQSTGIQDSVKSEDLNPVKGHKSCAGSEEGSVKMSSSKRKETVKSSSPCPMHCSGPGSKVETGGESTLSHSLSAADLLKETIAAARQHSLQSRASKTSEKSGRSHRSRNLKDQEGELELTPACLPNASPNEVVSDWLRSIPTNSSMLDLGNELNEEEEELGTKEMEEMPEEETAKEEESPEDEKVDTDEKVGSGEEEDKEDEDKPDAAEEKKSSRPALGAAGGTSLSKNWHCSAAVMKVLLSSSLGRCRSVPEVSPVYGRRLSTSATGLLDCLAQLQLIEPTVSSHEQKDRKQQYDEIMAILQSLWLTEPTDIEVKGVKEAKNGGSQQVTPPRSSSGVGMSSGSGGSAKDNGNQGGDETPAKETEAQQEEEAMVKVVEEEEAEEDAKAKEKEAEETSKADTAEEPGEIGEQRTAPQSPDSPKTTENPSSSDKSSTNDSSKSATDNERETLGDSGTPPATPRAPLSKRLSQDPDPVWVLHLLKKLERQFMGHYIEAMTEFKVRWDLDDSLILDTMITELKDEVSRRIQSSIEREMRKIQSRAGKPSRSPRPPQLANLSRESTTTEKRRRMLKVMKNQSVKTADSVSDEDTAGDFSDQRSDDEYCPCDACVRKKMAARPLKSNPLAVEAPVMMEFDLLKILQLKKSPSPAPVAVQPPAGVAGERMVAEDEGRNLEILEEEEEEYETKEDIKADLILEETIPEEDEEEDGVEDEEQEEDDTAGEEAENGEEDEGECTCQSAREEEEAEDTSNDTADEEQTGDDEAGENEGETGTGEDEEESDKETVKEATASEEESEDGSAAKNASNAESTLVEGNVSTSAEAEDEDGGDDATGEEGEESQEDKKGEESEEQEGDASQEEGASSKSQNVPVCVTEGEEADAEDSDDSKRQSDTGAEESGREETGGSGEDGDEEEAQEDAVEEFKPEEDGEEEVDEKEDGALLHQFTRTSVESQSGSMEEVDVNSSSKPVDSIGVPKMAAGVSAGGGAGQRRSRSPARVKRHKPKEIDTEPEDF
ncbi:uncharacterized protein rp1l1a [Leuresthes tenuis]|uniref:uncharacterized protein rp1l1a n=1 Tax=Leuresthes tenuis TaxID=355514 RepID=UPI003B5108A8